MGGPFALQEAIKLSKENQSEHRRLENRRQAANASSRAAKRRLDAAYTAAFDGFLAPFAMTFARLKNVELGELLLVDAVPELRAMNVQLKSCGIKAVEGLTTLAGSAAAGAATGGLTLAAVGAFATASTGTAISTLSGAAATSATLAWLGGGSLAAGGAGIAGGTMVLTGLVAVPALVVIGTFLWWKGEQELKKQIEVKDKLKRAEYELNRQLYRADLVRKRMNDTTEVVDSLRGIGAPRLVDLESLVQENVDYATYSPDQKAVVAELAAIATTLSAVMAAPLVDEKGNVIPLSSEAPLTTARAVVERLS